MRKTKRGIALLTVSAMLTGIMLPGAYGMEKVHAAAELPTPLVSFDFEGVQANGDIVTDTAKATGQYDIADSNTGGQALSLNGNGQWLNVTGADGSSVLSGQETLTFSYDAKLPQKEGNWTVYAAPDENAPTYKYEKYLGVAHGTIDAPDNILAERYNNNGSRPANAAADIGTFHNAWVHVDIVQSADNTTIYLNGEEKESQASSYALTDILGANSVLQIGKANWGSGEYGTGLIDNFRVYGEALSAEQITVQYQEYLLECDSATLTLPESTDRSLTLPSAGQSGQSQISWASSEETVMKSDGTVTRTDKDQKVTMTATLKLGDQSVEKSFEITVLKQSPEEDVAAYTKELTLNAGFVSENLTLPSKVGDAEVTWEVVNGTGIDKDGKVTRTEENQEVTLKATIKVEGAAQNGEKEFPLTVLAAGTDIASYVSSEAPTDIEAEGYGLQGGMKLAAEGESGYEAIHKDQPILYSSLGSKKYASPAIFRKADQTFGVIAADGGANGNVILYDSKDLITYENQRSVAIPEVSGIEKMTCVYDSTDRVYKIFILSGGNVVLVTTADFENFENKGNVDYTMPEVEQAPSDAVWAEGEALTAAEYEKLKEKFVNPYNTEITITANDVTLNKGDKISSEILQEKSEGKATAVYSDGTSMEYGINWNTEDIEQIDTSRPGTYTVNGTVGSAKYTDAEAPLITERADPYIVYNEKDKYYYFTASYPMNGSGDADGYDRLILRRAKTISGLADAEEVTIWDEKDDSTRGRFIWAPELHKIGNSWYLLSTAAANDGNNGRFNIRPFMVKCTDSDNMMDPANWEMVGNVTPMSGDNTCLNAMSLDMTYFEAGGRHYLVWADFTKNDANPEGRSSLYIATIDPENPTQLTSKCSVITVPEYSWERVRYIVNEGPAVIQNDGKVYLAFSASGTGSEYCVGLLTGDADKDLTEKENWTKTPYPILTSTDFDDEVSGPGHNSFTVDENGNPVIVYHARPTETHATAGGVHDGDPLYDPCRHCYVKPVFFSAADGTPILNLSDSEFAKEENVSITVTVEGDEEDTEPSLEYTFDEEYTGTVKDTAGSENNGVLSTEGASYVWDEEYGQVLYLDGDTSVNGHNAFLEFPQGFFDGKDRMTISMDVKEVTRSGDYFTFGIGQDNNKYLFLKTEPTKTKLAITTNSYGSEKVAQKSGTYPNNSRVWRNFKMVITPNSITLYRDGKKIASENNTGISMTDLGANLKAYIGKSFYEADKYFRGYFDNVKVYDWAMSADEVKKVTEVEETEREELMGAAAMAADSVTIPNADNIKGNITLPSEKNGVTIKWTSSDEAVISTKTVKNEGYDDTPAGVVTRQAQDTKVTLTAEFSKAGSETVTKTYDVTVKAAPQEVKEEDYVGYLFVRFNGTEENINQEQTYFSLSKDGLNWENLNGNQPVLTSSIGESGLRDHYIARSPEGDKFYMIATDLSIATNRKGQGATGWGGAGGSGSHSIVVWESEDLVNWSEPWLSEIAPDNAGCTWAPEFVYDEKTGEYVVYWSAPTLQTDDQGEITQAYENHAIYYCKTRDFRTFTEPEVYRTGGTDANGKIVKVIDSTMIEDNGTYYRYTKNESKGTIVIDKSDSVLGTFTEIVSDTLSEDLINSQGAVEGPIIFKLNEKTEDGEDQWCLMVDRFARGQGYYPLITTDLSSGEFRMLDSDEYSFPSESKFRHGYVMPVTAAEYSALQRKWGAEDYLDKYLLEQAIKEAEAVNGENYTEESYAALLTALEAARTALENVTTTAEADAAAAALQSVIDSLVPIQEVTLDAIQVTSPTKTEYQKGEELDLTGMTVSAVYSDGVQKEVALDAVTIEGYNKDQAGTQTITVTYEGKTAVFTVTVKEGSEEGGNTGDGGTDENKPSDGGNNNGSNSGNTGGQDGSNSGNTGGQDGSNSGNTGGQDGSDSGNKNSALKTGDAEPVGYVILLLIMAGAAVALSVKRMRG